MSNAYIRLMRLDKPIGTFLLWYPTAWALWVANQGIPPAKLLFLFTIGTFIMRSVGCVINDISDRNLDKFVIRTHKRPLTTGELSLRSALILTGFLLLLALVILINLPLACIKYAIIAVILTAIYPFCKRFISAPQCILGLAFSMGIPMAYAASNVSISYSTILLFCINMLWIIAYDTQYAMADKHDDILVGIKSTAIYFGNYDKLIVFILHGFIQVLWLIWGYVMQMSYLFYFFWLIAGLVFLWQQKILQQPTADNCIVAFLANNYYGAFMWLAIIWGL